jgi:hypothetical protein
MSAMSMEQRRALINVLAEVRAERDRQHAKWGEQNHPDGAGGLMATAAADIAKTQLKIAFEEGRGTFRHILKEEVAEAFAENDPAKLRAELVQVAAVAVQWIEAIDRRKAASDV